LGQVSDFSANDIRLGETLKHLIVSTLGALEAREVKARAQLAEHERSLASEIWHSVIPDVLPLVKNYRLKALSRPAQEVGGDFHSVAIDWLLVGDVSGKGIPAALLAPCS
jgi:serine phosphatase RsbU (regulator of sigma subunit)